MLDHFGRFRALEKYPTIRETLAGPFGQTPVAQMLREFGEIRAGQALPVGYDRGPMRHCYQNAYRLSLKRLDLVYHEGLAWHDDLRIPFEHAWCVDGNTGDLIDPTWESPEMGVYFGVPIPRDKLLSIADRTERYGVLHGRRGFDRTIVQAYWHWTPSRSADRQPCERCEP